MKPNFLDDLLKGGFNAAHSQAAVTQTREVVNKTGEILSKAVDKAVELAQAQPQQPVTINLSQTFNYGSGTVINLPPGASLIINQNPPTACISHAWLAVEDLNVVYHTMVVLGVLYGFCLYKDSLDLDTNSFKTLSYDDENLLESEISFWKKFDKIQDFSL